MPSVITHYLLAQRLLAYTEQAYKDHKIHQNALLWGAQGPDFLFAAQSEKLRSLASLLHTAPSGQTLSFLSRFARESKNEIEQSYALGFFAHYALDSIAHPFVLSGAGQMAAQGSGLSADVAHNMIEVNLDVIMVRYEKSALANSIRLQTCAPKDPVVMQHMALLYCVLLHSVLQETVSAEQVLQSAQNYRRWLKKHTDRTGFKKDFLLRREKKRRLPPGASVMYRSITEDDTYDYANINGNEWEENGQIRTSTFFDLFEQADHLATAMTDLFFSGGDICSPTGGKPFTPAAGTAAV
ncbi:MAG TPA: zinc dependent phospholipase C family protein [Candidatus Scatavimonas merdigallinarum]|uniref:Zinc dependent phospholipase C family protein n=1 Tax=Candidatus Scatavimonas merdigallinarum TaxID=2840914 RepID=A0A9D0ZII6_9FIRM|nr:zinc dependent phospholipase C family protein [Candidatus Scatavimonas merdigallinarum]